MRKISAVLVLLFFLSISTTGAAKAEKILFIPHDDRPISYRETVEVIEATGCEMIVPPKDLLGNAIRPGNSDELWKWFKENAPAAKAAVVSADSLLYGGLIPSRKHEIPEEVLNARLENFEKIRNENRRLKIYVFDSLMRTPQQGTKGDIEEPEYYVQYGADIFNFTRLADKKEFSGWTNGEEKTFRTLEKKIPPEILKDWFERRFKNLAATKKIMDFTKSGVADYMILGRDDNAPLSQTHRENREILFYAGEINLPETKFQSLPGIDEFNILLLNRAINEITGEIPEVCVVYNEGVGGNTVPAFSDEKISDSIDAAIKIAGGSKIENPDKADFVLLVNTDKHGETFYAHNPYPSAEEFKPILHLSNSSDNFAKLVKHYVKEGYPVGIADINFANGSDNALMIFLKDQKLLFKLKSYSGWNTATNSAGFALGTGIAARKMSKSEKNKLLTVRFLEDWIYQANVRTIVGKEIFKNFGDPSIYYQLGDKLSFAESRNNFLMREFARKNFPKEDFVHHFTIKNPWLRMFECEIIFDGDRN